MGQRRGVHCESTEVEFWDYKLQRRGGCSDLAGWGGVNGGHGGKEVQLRSRSQLQTWRCRFKDGSVEGGSLLKGGVGRETFGLDGWDRRWMFLNVALSRVGWDLRSLQAPHRRPHPPERPSKDEKEESLGGGELRCRSGRDHGMRSCRMTNKEYVGNSPKDPNDNVEDQLYRRKGGVTVVSTKS